MDKEERDGYFAELAATAKAVFELYHPNKINYATFGDLVPHVHVHVVPKYENGPDWGSPFDDSQGKVELEEQEYISVRIGVKEDAVHKGGMNLFGNGFGDYPQDIVMKMWFS